MVQWHDENETRIEVCLQETQERAEVTFDTVIGIRILYELDTSEFWLSTPRNILSSSWIFHVQSGGWFEFESQREDFYSKHDLITIEIQPALAIAVAWEPFEFQLWLNQLPSTPD